MPPRTGSVTLGLDARTVHRTPRRGTGKNLIDLYRALLRQRPDWRVIGYHRGDDATGLAGTPGYTPRRIDIPGDRFDAWQRLRLPLAAWRDGVHLLHCPANTCPRWLPVPTMLTVHDLMPLDAGDTPAARRFAASVRNAVRRRLTIITPSTFTADQLVERFGTQRERIVVNAWAPDQAMRCVDDPAAQLAVRRKYDLPPGPFVLHLGAPDPRKNTDHVLEAFAGLPAAHRQTWSLVIIGMDRADARQRLAERCRTMGVAERVRVHGFAAEADMPALFSAADVLAYPSLSEGFGLPILDAFVTRTVVLTSHSTSLPEVAQDAARYVDPTCLASIRRGLAQLTSEPMLRQELVERGLMRARLFTWDRTAARFIDAIERTLPHLQPQRPSQPETLRAAA